MKQRACIPVLILATALAVPITGSAAAKITNGVMISFDDTPIAYTLFEPEGASAARPVPVIFYTHGWGGHRERKATGRVKTLLDAGYAVLTWDARGFGDSGGAAHIDSQELEVRDVQALITLTAREPAIQKDGTDDPRMGMTGASYAGAIQVMTASADRRIDAIAPEIAWNDLPQSLKPGGVLKLGWGSLLYGAGNATGTLEGVDSAAGPQTGALATEIHRGYSEGLALNDWTDETRAWFDRRSTKHYIAGGAFEDIGTLPGLRAPALIIQGANDTLFPINEGVRTFHQIRRNGVDARLVFFCGGHTLHPTGTSCTNGDAGETIDEMLLAWFDRHVKEPLDDAAAPPLLTYVLQDGSVHRAAALPALRHAGAGDVRLVHTIAPTSGAGTAGTAAPNGVRIDLDVPGGAHIVGVPRARISVTGTGPDASLFFKLIDRAEDGTLVVVDDQAMAKRVRSLSAAEQRFTIELGGVSWKLEDGHDLLLEVSSTSNDHSAARTPFVADVEASVELPVIASAKAASGPSDGRRLGDGVSGRTETRVLGARHALPATGVPLGTSGALLIASAMLIARRARRLDV